MMREIKSCIYINNEPTAQRLFNDTLNDILPGVICFVSDDEHEAIDLMRDDALPPDVIFIEVNSIGKECTSFFKMLKAMCPLNHPLTIVHTANPNPKMAAYLSRLGVFAICTKPYSYTTVRSMVELYLQETKEESTN
jgi:response regulator RpfG family c-di-GMP phosphodiesterase